MQAITRSVPGGAAGSRVKLRLDPARSGRRWCIGVYRGQIDELDSPACPKGKVCPAFVRVRRVARFKFRVQASGDLIAPTFGGLQSATTCVGGPSRPGQMTQFNLSWHAATDDATPSSEIVYDVYVSSTSGGEMFARPSWTTAAGATSFRTPPVPAVSYFVVRARDQAGNEDTNKVERQGVNLCV